MWADLEKSIKDPQLSTLWRISEALDIPLSVIVIELENALGRKFYISKLVFIDRLSDNETTIDQQFLES